MVTEDEGGTCSRNAGPRSCPGPSSCDKACRAEEASPACSAGLPPPSAHPGGRAGRFLEESWK